MNYKIISYNIGRILLVEAALLILPAIVSIIYADGVLASFAVTIAALTVTGLLATKKKPSNKSLYAKEGYIIVALTWVLMSLFGALPFYLSGGIPNFIDAFFETVSGFTTTGSTILSNIEVLPKSLLFWRSFTHWIGGMGILVFVIAIMPKTENSSMHVMRAEVPGPTVGKLVSKLGASARILYGIYCGLSIIQVILLLAGGMPLFDSICTTFGTAGTGGFGILNNSIEGYNSLYAEMVIGVFMLIFGINFNLYYLLLMRQFKQALKSEELRCYLGIVAGAVIIISVSLITRNYTIGSAFRYAFFQVASIITTTGFSSVDFGTWPIIAQLVLLFLMFVGACAGSTGGGIKVSRLMILVKSGMRDIKKAINPRSIETVKVDRQAVEEPVVKSVSVFFATYIIVLAISSAFVALDGRDLTTTLTSVVSCLGNIGPGLGSVVGPAGNFSSLSMLSKIVLSFDMLAGRLELIPMLMIFTPYAWSRKYN
ncbi:MAG: TrkH family potassium uptake protein [Clostridia bacterium]|nr:TrkH family potassium uptake protein [Clostridia bacterium]